ncbi:MAG: hypothetical protein IKD37_08370 [Clostridia bacterium]|nr:hypothetical protein [Clostridia bacterium]
MTDSRVFRIVRIVSLIALAIGIVCSVSFLINYLWASIPSLNDGIGCYSSLYLLLFGEDGWSIEHYFFTFRTAAWMTAALAVENIALAIIALCKR